MRTRTVTLAALSLAALAACTTAGPGPQASAAGPALASQHPQPGSVLWGGGIATMADQYNRARPGMVAATGASAWVLAAPAPAFVATGPAPAPNPPAPPPAAVANRQPSAPASAADVVRPEAAVSDAPELQAAAPAPAPAAGPARLTAAQVSRGRELFMQNSCGACHALADAGGAGGIGPGFDGNRGLTAAAAFQTIHDGRGAMPSFGGQLSDADIRTLAGYIMQVKK